MLSLRNGLHGSSSDKDLIGMPALGTLWRVPIDPRKRWREIDGGMCCQLNLLDVFPRAAAHQAVQGDLKVSRMAHLAELQTQSDPRTQRAGDTAETYKIVYKDEHPGLRVLDALVISVDLNPEPVALTGIHFRVPRRTRLGLRRLQHKDSRTGKLGDTGQVLGYGRVRGSGAVIEVVVLKIYARGFLDRCQPLSRIHTGRDNYQSHRAA